jgi:hypothetical protein
MCKLTQFDDPERVVARVELSDPRLEVVTVCVNKIAIAASGLTELTRQTDR